MYVYIYIYIYSLVDGDDSHDDQARSKAMRLGAFQGDAFCRVPKKAFPPPIHHHVTSGI